MKRKFMVQRNFCDWDKLVFLWRENFEKHLDWWFSAAKSSEIEWLIRKHWDRNFKHQTIAKWRKTVFSYRYISICRHLNCVCMLTCFATLSLLKFPWHYQCHRCVCVCMCVWMSISLSVSEYWMLTDRSVRSSAYIQFGWQLKSFCETTTHEKSVG